MWAIRFRRYHCRLHDRHRDCSPSFAARRLLNSVSGNGRWHVQHVFSSSAMVDDITDPGQNACDLVGPLGLEPRTNNLKGCCSAN